jgi:hypothetical protein
MNIEQQFLRHLDEVGFVRIENIHIFERAYDPAPKPKPELEPTPEPAQLPELTITKAILTLNEGRRIPFPAIVHTVAVVCQVSEPAILGPRRHRETVRARQILWYVCRNIGSFCIMSFNELGRRTGSRDHTSVIHGVKAVSSNHTYFEPHLSQVYHALGVREIPTRGLGRE